MKTNSLIHTTILSASIALSMVPAAHAAKSDNRDAVHATDGEVTRNSFGHCIRTRWASEGNECGVKPVAAAPAPAKKTAHREIGEEERTLYFDFNKTSLREGERAKLDSLTTTLKSANDISGVSIVGYADRIGTTGYNERLSQQRAKNVEDYLRAHGYLNTTVAKTQWLGESVPVTQCDNSLKRKELIACLEHDRRVTVEITYEDTVE